MPFSSAFSIVASLVLVWLKSTGISRLIFGIIISGVLLAVTVFGSTMIGVALAWRAGWTKGAMITSLKKLNKKITNTTAPVAMPNRSDWTWWRVLRRPPALTRSRR